MKAALVAWCGLFCCLAACTVPGPVPRSGEKSLQSYCIAAPAAEGSINQDAGSIAVTVPAGTSVKSLVAVFTTNGVSVSVEGAVQESGVTANDFSSPVTYDVKAADGSVASYVVTVAVTAPLSSEKAITAFSFLKPAVTGSVDQGAGAISVTVPHGTDVTALVAVFAFTGTAVTVEDAEQESGTTVNDFSDPLPYVVVAPDGSTARYVVTVTQAPGSEKTITAFSIAEPPATGIIDQEGRIVRVRVPPGTDLRALTAAIVTTGASVSVAGVPQESGVTVNDFTAPVSYIVTAEDGTTATYVVRVVGTIGLSINELDVDQVGTDTAEFIELRAMAEVDTAGIVLVLLNGGVTPGVEYSRVDLAPAADVAAGTYLVVAGPNVVVPPGAVKLSPSSWQSSNRIQNGPADAVMVYDTLGHRVIDTVSYNGALHRALVTGEPGELDATEGSAGAPADSNTIPGSVGRSPDAQDTGDNGADFKFIATPTPGAPNGGS